MLYPWEVSFMELFEMVKGVEIMYGCDEDMAVNIVAKNLNCGRREELEKKIITYNNHIRLTKE